jgi:predicted HD superfamily hydrolase involved in NAD metabolism
VARVAEKLAKKKGLPPKKAYLTGLLHDIAKSLSRDKLIDLVKDSDWGIDKLEEKIPEIIHAPAGAVLVREIYGIKDRAVLEAIRYHTIGSPTMGDLAQIIFVADFIEPNRNYPGLKLIRQLAKNNFDSAIIAICDSSIKYNIKKDRLIHPNTLFLRNTYLGGNM